ncbi:MAG: phage virion morphogenesis protein [Magnetococcales bacterium]|nr:phage virion morphogenesis protein [Magnetococcales bacterium]
MSSDAISIRVDDARVMDLLGRIQERGGDLKTAFADAGESLVSAIQARFDQEKDPDGKEWQDLSYSTVMSRLGGSRKTFKKKGGLRAKAARSISAMKILSASGKLRRSYVYQADKDQLRVGSGKKYAAIHEKGGEAGRKSHRFQMPRRSALTTSKDQLNDTDMGEVLTILQSHMMEPAR